MLRMFALFAIFPELALSQLQTSNLKIELTDLQCVAVLTDSQYRATQGLWGNDDDNKRRVAVASRPELFRSILPGTAKFDWILPSLPDKGSVDRYKIESIGANRWVVFVPEQGLGCDLKERGGKKTMEQARVSATVYPTQATASPNMSESSQRRLAQVGLETPLIPTPQSTTLAALVIIDSGFDLSDKELDQRVDTRNSRSFVGGHAFTDPRGHGTIVAEVAGGRTAGFVTSTPLISFKVMDVVPSENGGILAGSEALVLRAILSLHSLPYQRLIVNMSLQLWGDPHLWRLAMQSLADRAFFVSAGGNGNGNVVGKNSNYVPSGVDLPIHISVGGVDDLDRRLYFSSKGDALGIGAPGQVQTLFKGGMVVGGTSFSAPQVAGAAARLVEVSKKLPSPADLQVALLHGARFSGSLIGEFAEPKVLNVAGAIRALETIRNGEQITTTPLRITRTYGTWSGSQKLTYSDLVTIEGEFGEEELQVYLNNEPLTILSKSPTKVEVVLPSMFRTAVWNGGTSNLSVARLSNGVPDANSAVLALSFQPEISQPGIGVVARENGPASEMNPIRSGETITIFLSGVESFAASNISIEISLGGVPTSATLEKTQIAGIFSVRAEVPCIHGQYGLVIKANARVSSNDFGVNYDAGVE